MAFVFGGTRKHFYSTNSSRHSSSSSWSLQNLITCLSMQALAKSISCDQMSLLRYTRVFSLVMPMYRPQYIDRVWHESPSSCTSIFDILLFNVTRMKHCSSFKPHCLKKSQFSPVVWCSHSGRQKRTLFLARWRRMYDYVTLPHVKHQWYAGWVGHFAYCRLRMWKFSIELMNRLSAKNKHVWICDMQTCSWCLVDICRLVECMLAECYQ